MSSLYDRIEAEARRDRDDHDLTHDNYDRPTRAEAEREEA